MLIVAATPIGNLGDASSRLIKALAETQIIACEDTRVASKLLHALGIDNRPKLIAVHDHNEKELAAKLAQLAKDTDVLLLSDAGMPTVSDPGFAVIQAAISNGIQVTVLPGPSAVITALALSGLATDRFSFEGFLPRKANARKTLLQEIRNLPHTLIFFESPQRLSESLNDLVDVFGADRQAAIARELTKLHEEVLRGSLSELAQIQREWRGEIVVVVAGSARTQVSLAQGVAQVLELLSAGVRLKDAASQVAENTGLSKRELYSEALNRKPR